MIHTILDAIELVLADRGEPQSPYWLASQLMEGRLWKASEESVRRALERDLKKWSEESQFVKVADDEYALRSWNEP